VKCEVCGTELPPGAMFCGECGRAVSVRVSAETHPDSGMPVDFSPALYPATAPGDTRAIEPLEIGLLPPQKQQSREPDPQPGPPSVAAPKPFGLPVGQENIEQDLAPDLVQADLVEEDDWGDPIDGKAGGEAFAAESPFPWGDRGAAIFSDSDDIEQTLIVPRREVGERFILQFSTGESVSVFGTGLLGRNPVPQPGEYFDQLVTISDPGKSVSKTHLEFGQEAGAFWVADRFSGNGSIVREPEAAPKRLSPGKRYRIVRGSRVEIAEQFFIVS
jgi:hypothetical protein